MLLKEKRIFIVESNSGNLALAMIFLRQQGAIIHYTRRGHEALDRIMKVLPIDVILMDLILAQNQSGFDVFEQVHSKSELKHIPIVAVSAADPTIAIPHAVTMGFSGYIAKPISAQISFQIVDVMAGKAVWDGDAIF